MKKLFISITFLLISTLALADCYTDMANNFNDINQNFKDALGEAAVHAGVECMAGIEAAGTVVGVVLAIYILGNEACESQQEIADIAEGFNQQYEDNYNTYCACLGDVGC